MPEGPFGGPRPFAKDETLKMVAEIEDPSGFNEVNFSAAFNDRRDKVLGPAEHRMLDEKTVAIDTSLKNAELEDLDNIRLTLANSIRAAGGAGVSGKVIVSTQNIEDARE